MSAGMAATAVAMLVSALLLGDTTSFPRNQYTTPQVSEYSEASHVPSQSPLDGTNRRVPVGTPVGIRGPSSVDYGPAGTSTSFSANERRLEATETVPAARHVAPEEADHVEDALVTVPSSRYTPYDVGYSVASRSTRTAARVSGSFATAFWVVSTSSATTSTPAVNDTFKAGEVAVERIGGATTKLTTTRKEIEHSNTKPSEENLQKPIGHHQNASPIMSTGGTTSAEHAQDSLRNPSDNAATTPRRRELYREAQSRSGEDSSNVRSDKLLQQQQYKEQLENQEEEVKDCCSPDLATVQTELDTVASLQSRSGGENLQGAAWSRQTTPSALEETSPTAVSDSFTVTDLYADLYSNLYIGIDADNHDDGIVDYELSAAAILSAYPNSSYPLLVDESGVASSADFFANVSGDGALLAAINGSGLGADDSDSNETNVSAGSTWPVKMAAVVEGDLVLGGLMMVHEREDSVTCGPVMPQGGVQALEAMLYTLDRLNSQPSILPNVSLGAHILDDCDKDTYGLEMAVDFIKGSISNIDGAEFHCNKTQIRKVISGVVGAASSVTSIQVANLLRLFKIPQVSFFSTSPELSNKQRFEYFTRTIPSDHYQVKAMVDIVRLLGWSYVSILYEESNYGIKAFEELEELLGSYSICIAVKEKLVKDSGVAEENAYDSIVQKLLTKPRARGAIVFGSDQEVAGVMRAVRRSNATGSFSWIGSDGWSARALVSDGNEPEVEGTLSVQPQANPVKGFEDYFLNLTVENNRRNPWFVEFWEDQFQCRYPNSSRTPYNQKYTRLCTGKETLTRQNTVFEDQLQFVSDAVMAFAYAIKDMHQDICHGRPGLCDAMKPTKGAELLKYLRKVNFQGLSGDRFHFDSNGDGPARYNIIHFKQVAPGKYSWIRVGEYVEGELRLNLPEVQFKLGQPKPPESVCSLPCELGQAKKYVEGESCCWHCFNCTQYQIRHSTDPTRCVSCPQGTVPDLHHVRCLDIPEEFLRPDSGWAIGAMSFSSIGILFTMFVAGVFMKFNDTPVVRASGRELSYVLLCGIFMCYFITFALVIRPTDIVCGVQRFGAGFCFTVVYAALLTKTNRISRIFNAGKRSAKRPSFISPRSQLIICSGLVTVQLLINGMWMLVSPPRAIHHYPTREDNLLVCSSYIDASYMIAFTYPIFLIVICTLYAVLTRKIPEAFNESQYIGFTMYTTCVIWLAFVPLYFGTANHVALRITSMSVTISLSATVTLVCLFSPKLYIILVRPERNVRQSMMPMRYTAVTKNPGTPSGSVMTTVMVSQGTCNQKQALNKNSANGNTESPVKDGTEIKSMCHLVDSCSQTETSSYGLHLSSSQQHLQKLNNNCTLVGNGPLTILQDPHTKELSPL